MTGAVLTDIKNQGNAQKYCYKIVELCFPSTFGEYTAYEGIISYLRGLMPDTKPATRIRLS